MRRTLMTRAGQPREVVHGEFHIAGGQFSSRWPRSPVPGMASTCGPWARVQAIRTWAGVAPWRAATSATAASTSPDPSSAPSLRSPAIAKYPTNAIPSSPHRSTSASEAGCRASTAYRFCTLTTSVIPERLLELLAASPPTRRCAAPGRRPAARPGRRGGRPAAAARASAGTPRRASRGRARGGSARPPPRSCSGVVNGANSPSSVRRGPTLTATVRWSSYEPFGASARRSRSFARSGPSGPERK